MEQEILVIDDDVSLRRVLEYNLQEEGYEVCTAATGEEGLEIFARRQPPLVITDMKMPGMDGLQVLKEIKKQAPDTLVIIITAFGAVDAAVEAMKIGAYDYITKPFNRAALRLTVQKALQFNRLAAENRQLRAELTKLDDFGKIVGVSGKMQNILDVVRKVADTEATVLITGESGTGKELVARAIHSLSSRRAGPFLPINCAAIPPDLLESELFGHVKGAFTGAIKDKQGKFRQADGGTLFLDEVGELPLSMQPKLLRVLQERLVEPVGGKGPQKIDVRIIAATNKDPEAAIAVGAFREDLYYRLAVIPIHLPPLRERQVDIPLLIRHFIAKHGDNKITLSPAAQTALTNYAWPGNIRELENAVARLIIMRQGDAITLADIADKMRGGGESRANRVINLPEAGYSLEQLEKEVVLEALRRHNWNQTAAARFLQIPRHALIYRMGKFGITPEGKSKIGN
ncbi:MAG: sigma-54 dependent transcriptional regulator [Syntrophales bacterium]